MGESEARPYVAEGEEHLRREAWSEAEQAFRRVIALDESSPLGWSKLGVALARQRRHGEAIESLRRAVELNPRYAPAFSNLGNVYREQGRHEEALRAYREAIELDPDYWIAHQNLGALYKEMGRFGEAVTEFRKATRLSTRGSAGQRRGCLIPSTAVLLGLVVILVGLLLLSSVP